jgi:hypothetical protein
MGICGGADVHAARAVIYLTVRVATQELRATEIQSGPVE